MTTFAYKARDFNGLLITGQMEGDTLESIRKLLGEQGLIPILVKKGGSDIMTFLNSMGQGVKGEDLMLFSRQFYSLFKAGMDMETLLGTLARQSKNKFFAESLLRIKSDVAAGSSLSNAFAKHPKVFDKLYSSMLATGEEAGILDEVLAQISDLLEKEISLKASVKSSTLYPKIVIFVLLIAAVVMLTVVIPKFESFYSHYDAPLPLPTRILMATSKFLQNYFPGVAAATVVGMIAFKRWAATTKGRFMVDQFKWKLPVFGPLGKKVANARFAHILGSLYRAGLPLTRALTITSDTIGNEAFAHDIKIISADVERGKGISEAMRQSLYLDPILIESTAVAEKTGSIDEMYKSVASHFDMEVAHTLKNLTTLLEPILLCLIFGMITVFVLAIFLPIWNMSQVVLH